MVLSYALADGSTRQVVGPDSKKTRRGEIQGPIVERPALLLKNQRDEGS